jgi:hypothetical protein
MMLNSPQLTMPAISVALPRITANVSVSTAKLGSGKNIFRKLGRAGRPMLSNNSRRLTPSLRIGRSFRRVSATLIAALHLASEKML